MRSYILSICIPTKDRPNNIKSTLDSILYEQIDHSTVQIVISDNSTNDLTLEVINKYKSLNIKYYRNPVLGFLNSIEALKQGDGHFLKLQNDYSAFIRGGLVDILRTIKSELTARPQILFTGGVLNLKNKSYSTSDFNKFLEISEYFNTWSTAFSIWKEDFTELMNNSEFEINDQFPHTSILLENNKKNKYLLYDKEIYDNQIVERKGGYNIFYNFCIVYPNLLRIYIDNGVLNKNTSESIIKNMKYKFIGKWLTRTVTCKDTRNNYSFDSENYRKNIVNCYGTVGFIMINLFSHLFSIVLSVKSKLNVF
jgi:abequosyltransferase